MSRIKRIILMDIDTLYDVRLAMLARHDNPLAVIWLHERRWAHREDDRDLRLMCHFDKALDYHAYYEEYFHELIKESYLTKLAVELPHILSKQAQRHLMTDTVHCDFTLYINCPYGYFLSEEEIEELTYHFADWYKGMIRRDQIHFVAWSYEDLTLAKFRQYGITDYYCYHWHKWFRLQHKQFALEEGIPTLNLWLLKQIADMDLDYKKIEHIETIEKVLESMDLFDTVAHAHSMLFNIFWVDMPYYSVLPLD